MQMSPAQVIALALAVVACGWDLRTRRIPQLLTLGGAASAFLFHFVTGGWEGLGASAAGWGVGLAIFIVPFALGGLGAGDVKLLGALGAWLGPVSVVWLGLYAGIAGGIMAVLVSLAAGYLARAVSNIWLLLTHWAVNGVKPLHELTLDQSKGPRLAYACPILAGTVVTLWLR
jgi:prepilin peptidase CpaA